MSSKALCSAVILLIGVCVCVPPTTAQAAPQQDTVKELSKDLADLDKLVMQLRSAEQQPTSQITPTIHIGQDTEGKVEPSQHSGNTAVFHQGEAAQVLDWRNDWALVKGQDNKVGWVSWPVVGAVAQQSFDAVVEQIIRQLEKMRAKYQQGPVVLSGFSIDVKVPPGASVEFTFK